MDVEKDLVFAGWVEVGGNNDADGDTGDFVLSECAGVELEPLVAGGERPGVGSGATLGESGLGAAVGNLLG